MHGLDFEFQEIPHDVGLYGTNAFHGFLLSFGSGGLLRLPMMAAAQSQPESPLERFARPQTVLFLLYLFEFLPGAIQIFEHFGKAGVGDVKDRLPHRHSFLRLVPKDGRKGFKVLKFGL